MVVLRPAHALGVRAIQSVASAHVTLVTMVIDVTHLAHLEPLGKTANQSVAV